MDNVTDFEDIQGVKFEIEKNYSIAGNLYIYDDIAKPVLLTTELIDNYLKLNPEKVLFDLEINSGGKIFRNNSLESIIFSDSFYDNQEIISQNQQLSIELENSLSMKELNSRRNEVLATLRNEGVKV